MLQSAIGSDICQTSRQRLSHEPAVANRWLDSGKLNTADITALIDIMSNKPNNSSGGTIYGLAYTMHDHFEESHKATQAADEAMLRALLAKLSITVNQGF